MLTVPLLRYQAINAAVAQAEANIRATEAMKQQTGNDLRARIVLDMSAMRSADRQLKLLNTAIVPRARENVILTRSAYEGGRASATDLIDAERSVLAAQRMMANLRAMRAKQLADIEDVVARRLDESSTRRDRR